MSTKSTILRVSLFALLVGMVASVPALAGSAVIGSVAGSMNASVGGQALLPNTTIFSGDSLQVRDGVAVVAAGTSGRMVFGHDTVASFMRDANQVTVLLSQGNVSVFHPIDGAGVRVKVGNVSIVPTAGFKTLGEVAMLNGSVVITAKEGALQVDDHGTTKNVTKGQTIVIAPKTADKGGNGGWGSGGGNTALEVGALGAAVAAAILAGLAESKANDASSNSLSAEAAANAAASAAGAATAAANAAASAAAAGESAAAAADSQAAAAYNIAACEYDNEALEAGATVSPVLGLNCPASTFTGDFHQVRR